jgi:hypothetical protein
MLAVLNYLQRSLGLAYIGSIVVAVLMTVASVAGLVDSDRTYPGVDVALLPLFVGQDALNLLVGLPILFGSMWLARRGALIGLLLWPGALFYVLYDYGYYALGAPFNAFFLIYIALMTLSAYVMIGIVVSIHGAVVHARLAAAVPARLVGGFIAGLAVLFTALWSAISVSTFASGAQLDLVPRVVTIMDLTIQLPALFIGGVLLMRRHALGYVVAAGLLLQAAAYLIGLSVITVLTEVVTGMPFDVVAVAPGLVIGAIGLAFIGVFVRGAAAVGRATHGAGAAPSVAAARGTSKEFAMKGGDFR